MFKIIINNNEITQYESFSINKNISNFVDTFSIELWNPWNLYSKTIPVWAYFSLYLDDVEIFRWICEKKSVSIWSVGSKLSLSWREELLLLTEDDISPLHKNYKKVWDNFIIKDVCKGFDWDFELANQKIIDEYEIPHWWVRKWQVIDDVVSMNNFYIYKVWRTIYKKELPTIDKYYWSALPRFILSTIWGWFEWMNNRILSVDLSEDISWCKSILRGFTYWTWKNNKKTKIASEIKNTYLLDWTYASRLRNIWPKITWPVINRNISKAVSVKTKKELDAIMQKTKVSQDIQIDVKITFANFINLNLLDSVEVFIEAEWIQQYMYIKELSYHYDSNNKFYTQLSLTPTEFIEKTK